MLQYDTLTPVKNRDMYYSSFDFALESGNWNWA